MTKRKPVTRIRSFGIYSQWDSDSKALPRILKFTTTIPAQVDIEFGLILNVKGAKNRELNYCIEHPGILDAQGNRRLPFDGTVFVKTNDWDFYLGDTIWEPIADKLGSWRMTIAMDGTIIADKVFNLISTETPSPDSD